MSPVPVPVRFGVVGCGYFGGEFARMLHAMDDASVAAVYGGSGRTAAAVAEELGCETADSLEALARRPDIDALIVASPSHLHKEAVLAGAKYGKHLFCEKPIALRYADCVDMSEACRRSSVIFMAGHIMHFMFGIQKVKQLIADGAIGDLLMCHVERTGWEEPKPVVSWKKNNAFSGGHLFHHIHELDLLQSFLGPARAVCAAGGNLAHRGEGFGDEDDILLLTLQFRGGALATMQYGSGFRWGEHYIKINGTRGAIRIDFNRSIVEVNKKVNRSTFPLFERPEENDMKIRKCDMSDGGVIYGDPSKRPTIEMTGIMAKEMTVLLQAIRQQPIEPQYRLLFDHTSALSSIRTAEAALRSKRERAWVTIEAPENQTTFAP